LDQGRIGEILPLFEAAGSLYAARLRERTGENWAAAEESAWDGLIVFLDGYVFERQRRDPRFPAAAVEVARQLQAEGRRLSDAETPREAWTRFAARLQGVDLDEKGNPMAPRGTTYVRGGVAMQTRGLSAVELAGSLEQSMVVFVRTLLREDRAIEAFDQLRTINGVGPKIASFFMRDVALVFDLGPASQRFLLQPVDIWIERIARRLWFGEDAKLRVQTVGERVASACASLGLSPEHVNAGMWYFAARIAVSEGRLARALADRGAFRAMLETHQRKSVA
jgi:hypothetical protein